MVRDEAVISAGPAEEKSGKIINTNKKQDLVYATLQHLQLKLSADDQILNYEDELGEDNYVFSFLVHPIQIVLS